MRTRKGGSLNVMFGGNAVSMTNLLLRFQQQLYHYTHGAAERIIVPPKLFLLMRSEMTHGAVTEHGEWLEMKLAGPCGDFGILCRAKTIEELGTL